MNNSEEEMKKIDWSIRQLTDAIKYVRVYVKENEENIFLFEGPLDIKSIEWAFEKEEYQKYKPNAYVLVQGFEIKLFNDLEF